MSLRASVLSEVREAGGSVWLWLAVAGLWSTLSPAHESGFMLLVAIALFAASLPGPGRRLLTLAAVWTVLAGAATWQPGLGLGTLGWSVVAVLALRFIAWPAWRQPGVIAASAHGGELLGGGRASALAFIAGALLYMLTGASPVASWGMFAASLAIGGLVWYYRRSGEWAAAASLAGGWLLNLAGDVLITDQLWQGVLLGMKPGMAWSALAGGLAAGSMLIGAGAALPQVGLDWPVRRRGTATQHAAAAGQSAMAAGPASGEGPAPAAGPASSEGPAPAAGPASSERPAPGDAPASVTSLHRGTIVWAVVLGLVALLLPEFGATWLRVADGGVWAASLAWWGLGVMLRDGWRRR